MNCPAAAIENAPITATLFPEDKRLAFLPQQLGGGPMMPIHFENEVYGITRRLCESYSGGYWHFYTTSNGAFFIALSQDEPMELVNADNYFEGTLSPQGAGVVATLMALSALTFRYPRHDRLSDLFYKLRDYAAERDDASLIFRAID